MVGVRKRGGSETKGEVRKIKGVREKGGARTPRTPAVYASIYYMYIYVYILILILLISYMYRLSMPIFVYDRLSRPPPPQAIFNIHSFIQSHFIW